MTVTTGGRGLSVAVASSGACSPSATTYSSSRTAWNPNADAISSIMSKSSRWLIVTICPSSLKAKATISLAGTLRLLASSETVMNSVTRTSVFSRSFSSRRFCSSTSRKLGPSSRRCTPLRPTGPLIEARVREMFCATASWSTSDFFPFLRFLPFSRRRSSSGIAPGAADATGRGGTAPPGAALATGLGRTGVGITGRGAGAADVDSPETGAEAAVGAAKGLATSGSGCVSWAAGSSLNNAAARSSSEGFSSSSSALAASSASRALSSRSASMAASACASASAAATSAAVRRRRLGRTSGAAATGSAAAFTARGRLGGARASSRSAPRGPARGAPPFPAYACWRRAPARRSAAHRAAAAPARPSHRPRPAHPHPAAPTPAAARPARSRRRGGRSARRARRSGLRLVLAALLGHLVEEGHELVGELGRHAGDLVHVLTLEIEDVLQRLVTCLRQHIDEPRRQSLELAQRDVGRSLFLRTGQRRKQRSFPAPLQPLAARVQVDLPAGELGRETHILAVPPDRERELILVYDRLDRLGVGVREHPRHARRRERQLGKPLGIGRPRHDVDALAVELVDHGLDARALEPHAGAHGIDRVVARGDRDLGAAARLAGGGADLHDLLLDLRHFELEQRLDEQRIGARQNQARALRRLLDPLEHRPDRVALVEVLAVILLAVGDDRLGFAELREHDDDLAPLDLLHFAREELSHLVGELLPDAGPLALAHPLDDALLSCLHRGAAERLERHLLFQHVAHLEVLIFEARFLERDLRARVFHGLHHGAPHDDPDGALELVDADLGPHVGPVALHQGGMQPVLQEVEQLRPLELLGVRQLADRGDYVAGIRRHEFLVTNPPPSARRGSARAVSAAPPPPPAAAPPSPRRGRPRSPPARGRVPPPWPARPGPRTAPSAGASGAVAPTPDSTPRARSGGPAGRPRRARLPTRGWPRRNRRPTPAATRRPEATRCAREPGAAAACRRYGGRPTRDPRLPVGTETTRRGCRRA